MPLLQVLLIVSLLYIAYQDFNERKVFGFLFPLVGILAGFLHFKNTLPELFMVSIVINITFVLMLILFIFLYSKIKLKKAVQETFGMGDTLFFLAISFSFSSYTFIVTFIFSLIFSLSIHLILKRKSNFISVPLAGYMSIFYSIVYVNVWLNFIESPYLV